LRLIDQCADFLARTKLVAPSEFFSGTPPEYAPQFIVAWIMNECDELKLNGTRKSSKEVRATYGTAQKMRASMTYAFGRVHGLGSAHWHRDTASGSMAGNPSVSEMVSRYMLSLHRRKVQAGETATSARAISAVLKIKCQDFDLQHKNVLQLRLPFRKTSQFGDIKPFVLHKLPESMAHLCPVRAYAAWIGVSQIDRGFVFRRLASGDRVSGNDQPMVRFASEKRSSSTPYGPLTCRRQPSPSSKCSATI
ncbi:hypothetical protein BJY52DRAFT_1126212, partial [Lactarius psammicola]